MPWSPLMIRKKNTPKTPSSPTDYPRVLTNIKQKIQTAQVKAVFSVNKELLTLYWTIGEIIVQQEASNQEWSARKVIELLANDLQRAFPGVAGFSRTNIFRMRMFYLAYSFVPQLVGQPENSVLFNIPWGHNVVLMEQIKDLNQRLWYAQKTLDHGWSRSILELQLKSNLYGRQGKAITNFTKTLPSPQSDIAQQTLKDPYVFDFLTLHDESNERDIENNLIQHIQKFLLELGQGFAFLGRQYHLTVDDDDYYLDLLFYHSKLHCYIVIELKSVPFKPEFAGKLNFYLSAVDRLIKSPEDKPSIGLLLCSTKKNFTVEYALQDINKPIGVASYTTTKLAESLPTDLKGSLPTVEEIEAELAKASHLLEATQDSTEES
jgi:predicted nuclease of restriction endonuclease-like (RecB) superfamily